MNSTNRGLNRAVLLLLGIVLLLAGALTLAVAIVPDVRDAWTSTAPGVLAALAAWFGSAPIPGSSVTWWLIAVIAVLVLVIIALVAFIFRQGRGHTGRLITDAPNANGKTIVEARVAEDLLRESLDHRPELVALRVTTYSVRGTAALKVSATVRRGVSPTLVTDVVEDALDDLAKLLGRPIPASIHVGGGFRAGVAKSTRLQ